MTETYTFAPDPADLAEAMILAGGAAQDKLWRKGVGALVSILYGVMMVLGGGGLLFLGVMLLTGQADDSGIAFILGGAFGGAFAVLWYQSLIRLMARDIVAKPFNAGEQRITLSPEGLQLTNSVADWRTDWAGVHDIRLGRRTLTFCTSGISIYLPISAIGGREEAAALLDRARAGMPGGAA